MDQMSQERELADMAVSPDGLMRWQLFRRPDGFYWYDEAMSYPEGWDSDDASYGPVTSIDWISTRQSGLFDTLDAAMVDALGEIVWLRLLRQM
ncbi:MAG: hypothetical protein CFE37_13325 [Alphaproteobacteria bacterium PA4]|nr:MAG: hypothetical protein CFE37_13325 [Alphaproteobacteria bacterium PA4]